MTATILMIRHAAHSDLGTVLSGRRPGLPLTGEGAMQAARLARRLGHETLAMVQSSPVCRACETAQAVAAAAHVAVETVAALDEIDFGEWTGRTFADLAADPRWGEWNSHRATAIPPGGESMAAVQDRAWDHVMRAAHAAPGRTIAMVSHGDVIRAVIARVLGLSLDHIHRFDVDPASVSRLAAGAWGARIISLNEPSHDDQ